MWEPLLAAWAHGQLLELSAVITTFLNTMFLNIGRMFDTLGVCDPVLFTHPVGQR